MRKIKFRISKNYAKDWWRPQIDKYWGGKIIYVSFLSVSLIIDIRKNWIKDLITGNVEQVRKI